MYVLALIKTATQPLLFPKTKALKLNMTHKIFNTSSLSYKGSLLHLHNMVKPKSNKPKVAQHSWAQNMRPAVPLCCNALGSHFASLRNKIEDTVTELPPQTRYNFRCTTNTEKKTCTSHTECCTKVAHTCTKQSDTCDSCNQRITCVLCVRAPIISRFTNCRHHYLSDFVHT